jgi:pimeloyl-ACP methyl ester carboxylesterase
MTDPFADPAKLRSSFGLYESALGTRPPTDPPRLFERNPIPTLILYGPEDHVIPRDFPRLMERAFDEPIGPFVVPGAGHFLQWERADVLNGALRAFLRP